MIIDAIKIRYINYACYEILLSNGKEIIIDPCRSLNEEEALPDYERADYVLLSHTHYDHTKDLGDLFAQYQPKVIVGAMSCPSLLSYFDINFDQVYPVYPNEKFEFEDFTLEVFRGKHTFMNNRNNYMRERIEHPWTEFPQGHQMADIYGSIEYMDYLITTNENIRIFINGGGPASFFYQNIYQTMKDCRPNIVFRQLTSKYTPEEFASVVHQFHPQLVLPLHQDGIERKTTMTIQEYVDRANAELKCLGATTRVLNPDRFEWYQIGMSVEALK